MFPLGDATRITFVQENPKRPGSAAHELYDKYKRSATVGEAKTNGCRNVDLRHDLNAGFLTILPDQKGGKKASVATAKSEGKKDHGSDKLTEVKKASGTQVKTQGKKDHGSEKKAEGASVNANNAKTAASAAGNNGAGVTGDVVIAAVPAPTLAGDGGGSGGVKRKTPADANGKAAAVDETAQSSKEAKQSKTVTATDIAEELKAQPTDSKGLFIRTKGTASSIYVGVSVHRRTGKWEARFTPSSGVSVALGVYDTEETAAEAYRDAVFGRFKPPPPPPEPEAPIIPEPVVAVAPPEGPLKKDKVAAGDASGGVKAVADNSCAPPAARHRQREKGAPPNEPKPPQRAAQQPEDPIERARAVSELQRQIDALSEAQLDQVLEHLQSGVTAGDVPELDLKKMPMQKLQDLGRFISKLVRQSSAPEAAAAVAPPPKAGPSAAPKAVAVVAPPAALSLAPARARPSATAAIAAAATGAVTIDAVAGSTSAASPTSSSAPRPSTSTAVLMTPQAPAPCAALQALQAQVVAAADGPPAAATTALAAAGAWAPSPAADLGSTEAWYVAPSAAAYAAAAPTTPRVGGWMQLALEEALPWFGDDGAWELGGEPDLAMELPRIPLGTTDPPGPCKEGCRCSQVIARPSELEKPWLSDKVRSRSVQEAMRQLEGCRGVFRRGKCSRQNRLQPAPVGAWYAGQPEPVVLPE